MIWDRPFSAQRRLQKSIPAVAVSMVKVLVAGIDKDFSVLRQPHASAVFFKLHRTIVEGLMFEVELCLGNRFHEIGF